MGTRLVPDFALNFYWLLSRWPSCIVHCKATIREAYYWSVCLYVAEAWAVFVSRRGQGCGAVVKNGCLRTGKGAWLSFSDMNCKSIWKNWIDQNDLKYQNKLLDLKECATTPNLIIIIVEIVIAMLNIWTSYHKISRKMNDKWSFIVYLQRT